MNHDDHERRELIEPMEEEAGEMSLGELPFHELFRRAGLIHIEMADLIQLMAGEARDVPLGELPLSETYHHLALISYEMAKRQEAVLDGPLSQPIQRDV